MVKPFQNMMQAKRERKKYNYKDNYRHELISFPFVLFTFGELKK